MSRLIKYITMEEIKKVIAAENKREYKLAYALGFGSGLRISEIVGYKDIVPPLKPENIDLEKHQIRVEQGKGQKDRITVTSRWLNASNIKLLPLDIKRRTLQYRFTKITKKVLGKSLTFHSLRHGFGNFMVNVKGVPLPMVQTLMGHSRVDTTGIYTKANPVDAINKAWEQF